MSSNGTIGRQRFAVLDGSRGIAAIVVVAVHGAVTTGLIPMGPLAVDYFFALSGFVLAYAYERRLKSGEISVARYFVVRAIRLYPMLAFGMLLGACLIFGQWILWHQGERIIRALPTLMAGLLLLPAPPQYTPVFALMPMPLEHTPYYTKLIFPFDIPAWSLFFEAVANIVFPLARRMFITPVLVAFVVLAGLGLSHAILAHGSAYFGWAWDSMPGGLLRIAFSFAAGLLIFRISDARLVIIPARYALVPLLLLLGFLLMPYDRAFPDFAFAQAAITLVCWPGLVLIGAHTQAGPRLSRVCDFLGRISYPLYLVHYPIVSIINLRLVRLHGAAFAIATAMEFVIPLIFATIVTLSFDEPVRRFLSARFMARRALHPGAHVAAAE